MKSKKIFLGIVCVGTIICNSALSQDIASTVHNLSVSGTGSIKATTESEICVFCHTPHNSSPVTPLWNRSDPGQTYTLYNSSTIQANPGQPDGSSILCLSCHDGTIALGNVISRTTDIDFSAGITTLPAGNTNLTTNLTNDHPISFTYNSTLATNDGQLKDPSQITWPVALEGEKLQCTSCHDPHKNPYSDFLKSSSEYSSLCKSCHDRNYWTTTSHNTSTATWNSNGTDPWQHTPSTYDNVAKNACENCHNPHNAQGSERLLNNNVEENNCLVCHNGNVASKDIQTQINKTYSHDVYSYNKLHAADEIAVSQTQHVECEDCHNPHAARSNAATAPNVNGFLEGVRGVNQSGNEVNPSQYEYEVCYRCHADSPNKPGSHTTRVIQQDNVRLEFDMNNPSYHPVVGQGVNTNVQSLISPLTESSVIYCTDCHASNGTSPKGPHGSIYPSILKYRYETADYTTESATNYELCYSCHSRTSILSDNSFGEHDTHIRGEDTPCNICHDPHGISSSQGNSSNNTHLINFNSDVVTPNSDGDLYFVDNGLFSGRCALRCHGKNHRGNKYSY